jgi:carbamoyltransferase
MGGTFGSYGPSHPHVGNIFARSFSSMLKVYTRQKHFYPFSSRYARERLAALQEKLRAGEDVYLVGIGSGVHNSGAALVQISPTSGVRLLYNNEEERFSAIKHCSRYPELAVQSLLAQMERLNLQVKDIHACLTTFNFSKFVSNLLRTAFDELPASLALLKPAALAGIKENIGSKFDPRIAFSTPARLGQQLGLPEPFPIIMMPHHDNHAYFSYAVSPFSADPDPVMVAVIDGFGDESAISLYVGQSGSLKCIYRNEWFYDSLGMLYGTLSSTLGGWPMLSSEGRYMGAAAWGNNNRATNPYYLQLRQLVYLAPAGKIYINRALANWHVQGWYKPYKPKLIEILGQPIPFSEMWNPDAILNVEDVKHADITQDRVDKAAAVQLLFEDVMFHIIRHFIQTTGSHKLIFTGGCALNCIANMRLLQEFDTGYYEGYLGQQDTRLHLWVPPTPSDTGVTMGAAYAFALAGGASMGPSLQHAFYCGLPPTSADIQEALEADTEIAYLPLGNAQDATQRQRIADLLAFVVSRDGIVGLFQGMAETGPRALGHRSILANPCNPQTRANLNAQVKFRELIRPLAPMLTYEAAARLFDLAEGASDDNYNAYNYMVLTAPARPESFDLIPAVIHKDGTSRLQLVREESDPFTYAYLKAMGRRAGVEVSVNTSLNVGSPIVQTPKQAIEVIKRSKGMDGLLLIGDDGQSFLAWHTISAPPKDGGARLRSWLEAWQQESGALISAEQASAL